MPVYHGHRMQLLKTKAQKWRHLFLISERKIPKVSKRKFPNGSSQMKVPKRKLPTVSKREITSESARKFPNESTRTKENPLKIRSETCQSEACESCQALLGTAERRGQNSSSPHGLPMQVLVVCATTRRLPDPIIKNM